ncbi:hypothetical protein ACVWZA_003413 [Sphingomonas sp. UYAg733]
MIVYVLQHSHRINDDEDDVKFIGVYASHDDAKSAAERTKLLPGFMDAADGFNIDKYLVGEDNWIEGYITT